MIYDEIEKKRQEQLDEGRSLGYMFSYSACDSREEVLDLVALLVSRLERIDVYDNKESVRNRVKRNLAKGLSKKEGGLRPLTEYHPPGTFVYDTDGRQYAIEGTLNNVLVNDGRGNYKVFTKGDLFVKPVLWLGDLAIYWDAGLVHEHFEAMFTIKDGRLWNNGVHFDFPKNDILDPKTWRLW